METSKSHAVEERYSDTSINLQKKIISPQKGVR